MTSSEDFQALTFNRQADTESEFREDSTPFHVLGAFDVPDFRPFIVSREGHNADTQRPVWSCTIAGVFMLGDAPRTHAETEASRTKASGSSLCQAGGSPRHHLLRQGAARCKEEQPKISLSSLAPQQTGLDVQTASTSLQKPEAAQPRVTRQEPGAETLNGAAHFLSLVRRKNTSPDPAKSVPGPRRTGSAPARSDANLHCSRLLGNDRFCSSRDSCDRFSFLTEQVQNNNCFVEKKYVVQSVHFTGKETATKVACLKRKQQTKKS